MKILPAISVPQSPISFPARTLVLSVFSPSLTEMFYIYTSKYLLVSLLFCINDCILHTVWHLALITNVS